jgi:hypothetical protein
MSVRLVYTARHSVEECDGEAARPGQGSRVAQQTGERCLKPEKQEQPLQSLDQDSDSRRLVQQDLVVAELEYVARH